MKTIILILFASLALNAQEVAFKPHFVNMTEFGGLFGRVLPETNNGNGTTSRRVVNRLNFTLQTFNGAQISPRWAVGATVGVDWYNTALLMPVSAGVRYDFAKNKTKKSTFFTSLDAGHALNWLHADASNYETKGGFLVSPGLGLKIGMKGGSAFLMTLNYKRQEVRVQNPIGWNEFRNYENRVYNRMAFRIGFSF